MKRSIHILFLAAALLQLGATDCGNVIRDPGFDLWCAEELCAWKVERGEIKRVATWHEGDSGVELVGNDVAIAQLSPVDSSDGQCRDNADGGTTCTSPDNVCIEFSLLANIDERATVDLNVDVFNDGRIDYTQRLPIASWQRVSYRIVVGQPFAGIRFQLAKAGDGTAQLANIGAVKAKNCDGLPIIDPGPAPLGSPCKDAGDCVSGLCGRSNTPTPFDGVAGFLQPETVCVACDFTANACSTGNICGVGEAVSPIRAVETVCVPLGSKVLGDNCYWPTECASGRCVAGMCSTCKDDVDCNGDTCGEAWPGTQEVPVIFTPFVCNPNAGRRQSGEPCASHLDCASAQCNGVERKQCDDGRDCVTAAQCPFLDHDLKNGACNTVGIQGGSCQ